MEERAGSEAEGSRAIRPAHDRLPGVRRAFQADPEQPDDLPEARMQGRAQAPHGPAPVRAGGEGQTESTTAAADGNTVLRALRKGLPGTLPVHAALLHSSMRGSG